MAITLTGDNTREKVLDDPLTFEVFSVLTRTRTRFGEETPDLTRTIENLPPAHWGREYWDQCHWTHRNLIVPAQFYENPPY